MGLSILIPVYNYEVSSLVKSLADQLKKTGKQGEIIILDDCSDSYFISKNKVTSEIPNFSFYQNERNEGREAVRKKLSVFANFEYLLFIDCDCEIIDEDFLAVYFGLIAENIPLASGGTSYSLTKPANCEFVLHWKYVTFRQNKKIGNKGNPAFMSNNFLIKKELFLQLRSLINFAGYGHEDSLWGIQFEQLGIHCINVKNPVFHSFLETSQMFMVKSEEALENLLLLSESIDSNVLSKHVKIFRWYRRLVTCRLSKFFLLVEKPFHNLFYRNLISCRPILLFFDIYRLAVLIQKGFHRSSAHESGKS